MLYKITGHDKKYYMEDKENIFIKDYIKIYTYRLYIKI